MEWSGVITVVTSVKCLSIKCATCMQTSPAGEERAQCCLGVQSWADLPAINLFFPFIKLHWHFLLLEVVCSGPLWAVWWGVNLFYSRCIDSRIVHWECVCNFRELGIWSSVNAEMVLLHKKKKKMLTCSVGSFDMLCLAGNSITVTTPDHKTYSSWQSHF